jgi:CRISPR/Cas system-associated endonuclease Cas3-HD
MTLNATFSKDFLKPEYQGDNLSKGVPRGHLVEGFDKMLNVIQRYFTCEGRFNMIYQYHIRLLLHFTGKDIMNIPFYLFRSMGKMVDRVQAKSKDVDTSVFHSGLIRMLVMEDLKKINIAWEKFIASTHMQLNVGPTPQSKVQSPLQDENVVHTETSKNRKGKHIAKDDEAPKEQHE